MNTYSEEIVFAPSEDQKRLAGVMMRPTGGPSRSIGIICIHGTNGHFYWPTYVHLGRELARRGYLFVSGNTRAHDVASYIIPWGHRSVPGAPAHVRLGGNSWERWDEGPYDVTGWIDFVVSQGVEQAVLFGHSLGVARITYYQTQRQDPRVVGLILASGGDRAQPLDPARLELAERMVAQGQEDASLPVQEGMPPWALESAANVVHWERHAGKFAVDGHTPWIASIRTPILATLGTTEYNPNLRAVLEDMRGRAVQAPRFDIHVIEGADHSYTERERDLAKIIAGWLDALPATRGAAHKRWWGGRQGK